MRLKKISVFLLFVMLHVFLFAKTIRIGYFIYPGYQEYKNGEYSGFGYEYLKEIQKFTNWNYEFIREVPVLDAQGNASNRKEKLSYSRALEMLENGDLDIVGSVRKSDERANTFLFPLFSCGKGYEILTTRNDFFPDESHEAVFKVGLRSGCIQGEELLRLVEHELEKNLVFIYFDTTKEMLDALHKTKEIDYILSTSLRQLENERILHKFNAQEHYFAINPYRKDILDDFNAAHEELFLQNASFEDALYEKYYQNQIDSIIYLTQEEKAYIKENPIFYVAHETNWTPIDYEDKNGNPLGITPSILSIIEKKLNMHFEYISFERYMESFALVKDKNNVIIASFAHDYAWAEKKNLKMTVPLFNLPVSSVALKHYDNIYDDSLSVVGIEGYYLTEKYVLPHKNYLIVSNLEECIDAVREKKADIAFVPTYSAERFLQNPKNAKLHYHSLADIQYEIAFAFDMNCDPMLFSIINKAVNSLTPFEINQSVYNNTLYLKEPETLLGFFYKHFFLIMGLVFTGAFFVIGFAFLGNINYRRRKANEILSIKNRELQKAFSFAEQANRSKTEFLSRVSHEIRTPIHVITGMTDLSFDKVSDKDFIYNALKKISSASDYLLSLVNDVLDMSRIERGKTVINNDNFYVTSVLDTIASLFEEKIKHKGLKLLVSSQEIEHNFVYGDKEHLEQVLINLLDNALKYTEKGQIEVKVFEEKRASVFSLFTFMVKDTGQGIDAERLQTIWEPFEKGKTKIKVNNSFGLGLSIVKSLVHLMGGTVQVESKLSEGSTFTFSVPLKIATEFAHKRRKIDLVDAMDCMFNKEKILVVEDNELNADIVRMMLERKNLIVEIVDDGQKAVNRLLENEPNYYSLVLMDIRMPIMDGKEATKQIRNSEREDLKKIPIIAMSADAFAEEIKIAQSFGMNEYLTKPVRRENLYEMLLLFLPSTKMQ